MGLEVHVLFNNENQIIKFKRDFANYESYVKFKYINLQHEPGKRQTYRDLLINGQKIVLPCAFVIDINQGNYIVKANKHLDLSGINALIQIVQEHMKRASQKQFDMDTYKFSFKRVMPINKVDNLQAQSSLWD